MPLYAVDADVFAHLQRVRGLGILAELGRLPVLVTDTVWDELVLGPILTTPDHASAGDREARARLAHEARQALEAIAGEPTLVIAPSPEADLLARLKKVRSEGPGEDSVIALALARPDVVPVLIDRPPLARAVEELDGRPVLSLYGFLGVLRRGFPAHEAALCEVAARVGKAKNLVAPLWW